MKKIRNEGILRKFVRILISKELLKNKVYALILMGIGYGTMFIDMDCTIFVFTLLFGIPLFFCDENAIV